MLIAIESRDGIGKTTLINLIKSLDLPNVAFLAFPNEHTASGILTRKILNNSISLSSNILQTAFIINFYESIEYLNSFKNSPNILILDRYYFSTMAYTFASPNTDNYILQLLKELPEPDTLIYLEGKQRKESAEDKHDIDIHLQTEVHKQYEHIMSYTPHHTIYNRLSPQSMLDQFISIIKTFKYDVSTILIDDHHR